MNLSEIAWYAVSGVASTIASQGGYSLCFRRFGFSNVRSKIISWFAAVTAAFVVLKLWTFPHSNETFAYSLWTFYSTRLGTAVLTVFLIWLIIDRILVWDLTNRELVRTRYKLWPEAINLSVTMIEVCSNYFIAKYIVF